MSRWFFGGKTSTKEDSAKKRAWDTPVACGSVVATLHGMVFMQRQRLRIGKDQQFCSDCGGQWFYRIPQYAQSRNTESCIAQQWGASDEHEEKGMIHSREMAYRCASCGAIHDLWTIHPDRPRWAFQEYRFIKRADDEVMERLDGWIERIPGMVIFDSRGSFGYPTMYTWIADFISGLDAGANPAKEVVVHLRDGKTHTLTDCTLHIDDGCLWVWKTNDDYFYIPMSDIIDLKRD